MTFEILESTSKANGYLLNDDLLIDCGFSYIKHKAKLKNVKYVCLTHIHGDHFKPATIRKLAVENEGIRFVCPPFLFDDLEAIIDKEMITIISGFVSFRTDYYNIETTRTEHDVKNVAYIIDDVCFRRHIHATDLATTERLRDIKCDSISLEANHCYETAKEIIAEANEKGEYSHLERAIRYHLDVENAIDLVKQCGAKTWYVCHIGDSTKKQVVEAIKTAKLDIDLDIEIVFENDTKSDKKAKKV